MKLDSSVGCFMILLSVLGGFLIAGPLLDAGGAREMIVDREFRVMVWLGAMAFGAVLLLYGMRTILLFVLQAATSLGNLSEKPGQSVAITLIICGTTCLLGVTCLEYLALSSAASQMGVTTAMNSQMNPGNMVFAQNTEIRNGVRVFAHLFSALIFVAGSGLISLGVWSSLPKQLSPN